MNSNASSFLQRARLEAARYGSDRWVFIRELLQNARDAGAHHVSITTSKTGGRDRVTCLDDGTGMVFEHARRYLFALYSSSKRGRSRTAGRFGIGFWSVLRFDPEEIVVRSRCGRAEGWAVRLDGRLQDVKREPAAMRPGTEIVLVRPSTAEDLEESVISAVLRDAPYLRCRHRAGHPVEVTVNGRLVRQQPTLPPPSLSFARRGSMGVVGLGPQPGVVIFAHGFRVREAATLDELLVDNRPRRPAVPDTVDGLAPRVVIDSRELEVLMARGDAREDRALNRLVATGHGELRRLVRAELDRHLDLPVARRIIERIHESWSSSKWMKWAMVVASILALGLLAVWGLTPRIQEALKGHATSGVATDREAPRSKPYQDLWGRYRGPDVTGVGGVSSAIDLRFRPKDGARYFAGMWLDGILGDGSPSLDQPGIVGPYQGAPCTDQCLQVEVTVDSPPGLMRVPIAAGHVLDPASLYLDGRPLLVVALATGQPAVQLATARRGSLRYRSRLGAQPEAVGEASWPDLPPEIAEFVDLVSTKPAIERARATADFVSRRITYDTSEETASRHRDERGRSIGIFRRALNVGAGDCDVQNSLVTAMLESSGLRARLAVGWVAADGRAQPGLHAWAEYLSPDGVWRAVDASIARVDQIPHSSGASATIGELSSKRDRWRSWLAVGLFVLVVFGLSVFGISTNRGTRRYLTGSADDVEKLLRGAAVRPGAFNGVHSISSRRLLQTVGGGFISLSKARELAKNSSLACGSRRSGLGRRAARGGGCVLDLEQPEAAAVAEVLAAVDVDRWQESLDGAESHELTKRVEARMAEAGEPCRILVGGGRREISILDGTALGLDEVWVVVGGEGDLWLSIRRLLVDAPASAGLVLAEEVLQRVGSPTAVRQRCLAGLALESLTEASTHGT